MDTPFILLFAGMFFIPLVAVLIPIYLGQRYGNSRSKKSEELPHTQVGSVTGAAFGLLAFLLAFTFQIVSGRYESRKQFFLEEIASIRTAWLRAGLVPEPYLSRTRQHLTDYVDMRAININEKANLDIALTRSKQILDSLWHYAEEISAQDHSSESYALYISSINEVIDAHNKRIAIGLHHRIPASVFIVLFIIEFLTMYLLGYQIGISGKASFRINVVLAVIFAVVMFLIIALDRPEYGLSRLSQNPMQDLQQQLHGK